MLLPNRTDQISFIMQKSNNYVKMSEHSTTNSQLNKQQITLPSVNQPSTVPTQLLRRDDTKQHTNCSCKQKIDDDNHGVSTNPFYQDPSHDFNNICTDQQNILAHNSISNQSKSNVCEQMNTLDQRTLGYPRSSEAYPRSIVSSQHCSQSTGTNPFVSNSNYQQMNQTDGHRLTSELPDHVVMEIANSASQIRHTNPFDRPVEQKQGREQRQLQRQLQEQGVQRYRDNNLCTKLFCKYFWIVCCLITFTSMIILFALLITNYLKITVQIGSNTTIHSLIHATNHSLTMFNESVLVVSDTF